MPHTGHTRTHTHTCVWHTPFWSRAVAHFKAPTTPQQLHNYEHWQAPKVSGDACGAAGVTYWHETQTQRLPRGSKGEAVWGRGWEAAVECCWKLDALFYSFRAFLYTVSISFSVCCVWERERERWGEHSHSPFQSAAVESVFHWVLTNDWHSSVSATRFQCARSPARPSHPHAPIWPQSNKKWNLRHVATPTNQRHIPVQLQRRQLSPPPTSQPPALSLSLLLSLMSTASGAH